MKHRDGDFALYSNTIGNLNTASGSLWAAIKQRGL
jgi:hypothetical protein